jgi:hypothetical protein
VKVVIGLPALSNNSIPLKTAVFPKLEVAVPNQSMHGAPVGPVLQIIDNSALRFASTVTGDPETNEIGLLFKVTLAVLFVVSMNWSVSAVPTFPD